MSADYSVKTVRGPERKPCVHLKEGRVEVFTGALRYLRKSAFDDVPSVQIDEATGKATLIFEGSDSHPVTLELDGQGIWATFETESARDRFAQAVGRREPMIFGDEAE